MADEPKKEEPQKPAEEPAKPDPRDEKIAGLETSVGDLTRRLEAQSAIMAALAAGGAGAAAGAPGGGDVLKTEDVFDYETFRERASQDPAAALDYYHQHKVAPLERELVEQRLVTQATELADVELKATAEQFRKLGVKNVEQYAERAKAWMAKADPRFRASKGAWSLAFAAVLAGSIPELLKEAAKPTPEPPALEKGGPVAEPKATAGKLTPEEKRIAEQFGLSEEDYVKWKPAEEGATE